MTKALAHICILIKFNITYFLLKLFSLDKKILTIFFHLTDILYFSLYCIAGKTRRISIKILSPPVNLPVGPPPQHTSSGITVHCSLRCHQRVSLSHIAACMDTVDEELSQGTSVLIKMSAPKTIPKDAQVILL